MGFKDFCLIFTVVIVIGADFQAQALDNPLHQRLMTCHPSDLRALQGFMAVLQTKIQGWEEDNADSNCCQWEGVTCDSSSSLGLESQSSSSSLVEIGRVVKLELPSKRLVGKLSESLGYLDQLRTLNLSHNFLKSSLPVSVFNLSNLRVLDLSNNDFSGPVSDPINLPSILYLDLSQNFLNGPLPGLICGVSSALRVLKLAGNSFSGEVPYGFGYCGSLEHLNIGMNDLSGVSEGLFRLRKLSDLILAGNRLSGPLREGIGNLTSLLHLDISSNGFSGTIPNVFNRLGKLQSFVADSNCFTGNIPESLSNSPTISRLNLRNNSLEGTIELNCSAMVNLTSLDLATNQFSGPIPDNLPSCQHLNNLNLARNNFTGEIPQSFKDFHSLSYFSLSNTTTTNLSSTFRILQQCKNLTTLVLSLSNFHDDELPTDPDLHFDRLKVLVIANCGLTGSVPQWLRKSEKLQVLDLSCNNLVGTIPVWLGDFRFLFYLDISNNYFIGEIPRSLTALPSLISRDTPIQEPSPDFPFFMKRNTSARGLLYNRAGSFPPTLDLCCNNLSGPIWPEFGNLRKLHVLDLKFNDFSGEIPSDLSGMSSLETLYLSHNCLSGTIPSSLVRLSFLSKFSVAYNKLHGPIPLGGQFPTFPSSSFEGNDLCGDQASSCNATENRYIPGEESEESTRDTSFVDGITGGIGFGVALGLVFGAVLFHETSKYY